MIQRAKEELSPLRAQQKAIPASFGKNWMEDVKKGARGGRGQFTLEVC